LFDVLMFIFPRYTVAKWCKSYQYYQ